MIRIQKMILFLFLFFNIADVLLCCVCRASDNRNFPFHDFIVLFNLLNHSTKRIKLLLGLCNSFFLFICLLFFSFILACNPVNLTICLSPVSFHNVVIIMGLFKSGLHFGQLVLHTVKLHTCLFSFHAHLFEHVFFLSEFEFNFFVTLCQISG